MVAVSTFVQETALDIIDWYAELSSEHKQWLIQAYVIAGTLIMMIALMCCIRPVHQKRVNVMVVESLLYDANTKTYYVPINLFKGLQTSSPAIKSITEPASD